MKKLINASKIIALIGIVLCFIISVVLLLLGGFAPLGAIASGILLIYYAALLLLILIFGSKIKTKLLAYLLLFLVLAPMLWGLADPYGLMEFCMPNIHLDMK